VKTKKVGELRGDIGVIRNVLTPFFFLENPEKMRNVRPGDAFEDTAFQPGFEIVKFKTRLSILSASRLREIDTTNSFLASSSIR
jgi:hypothetical protein